MFNLVKKDFIACFKIDISRSEERRVGKEC